MIEQNKIYQIVLNIFLIIISMVIIFPLILLFISSITEESALILNGYTIIPSAVDFSAYSYILTNSESIFRGYGISIFITIIGTIINLLFTALYAYPLYRKDLPYRGLFAFILFFTMLFNGGLVPSYIIWTKVFHIKNTMTALIVPNLMMNAFFVIMMRTYFSTNIDYAIIEAAKIDGASEFKILFKIVFPIASPIFSTVALLVGLVYWNDWMNGLYYINKDSLYSIQVLLYRMLLDTQFLMSSASKGLNIDTSTLPSTAIKMAIAVMGALPVIIIYPFSQKYLIKGITIGSVKG